MRTGDPAAPDPTRGRLEGRQTWRDLLFLHWSLPPEQVRPVVPAALSLDLHDAKAWVGVVAFEVRDARPPLLPPALGLDFLEVNARTYVRGPGGEPAVWFFSLDAASRLAVAGGRLRYGVPYRLADMDRRPGPESGWVRYRSRRRSPAAPGVDLEYRTGEPAGEAAAGSLDAFLVERYTLFVVRGGAVRAVRVRHRPYPLRTAEARVHREDLLAAAGIARPTSAPVVHFADGVEVEVRAGG